VVGRATCPFQLRGLVTSLDQRTAPERNDHIPLGIVLMLGTTVTFAASQAISKWQAASYPITEVLFLRAFFSLLTCAILILPGHGLGVFRTRRIGAHAARNFTQTVAQSCLLIALSLMPIASAMAINFSTPLFAALVAAIWLKERIGLARGLALVTGFLGVLVVASPGADAFRLGALFAIANAVLYGSVTAVVRGLSATESAETLTMYQMVFLTAFFGLALIVSGFVWPGTVRDWIALTLNGVINGIGQYWWTRSLSMAPPAAVGPFYYFTLVWAMLLGFVFWGDIPSLTLLAGSAVVVASGLFLLWHESNKKPVIEPAEM
jgi:drug/metabolite transporter (DMT)-like permease